MNQVDIQAFLDAVFGKDNPLRSSIEPGSAKKVQSNRYGYNFGQPSKQQQLQAAMSPLERDIDVAYTKPVLEAFYKTFVEKIVRQSQEYAPFYKNYYSLPEKIQRQKVSLVRLFATMFRDEAMMRLLLDELPKGVVGILQELVYEVIPQNADEIAARYGMSIPKLQESGYSAAKNTIPVALGLCAIKLGEYVPNFSGRGRGGGHRYTFFLPLEVRDCFRRVLPVPASYSLQQLKEQPSGGFIYQSEQTIYEMLPLILSYLAETPLEYSANGKKLLKMTVKNFCKAGAIKEFFPDPDRDTDYMATTLLLQVLSPIQHKIVLDNSEVILRKIVASYADTHNISVITQFLTHLKSGNASYTKPVEKFAVKAQWVKLFSELPSDGSWVTVNNLLSIAKSRFDELAPLSLYDASSTYFIEEKQEYNYTKKRFIHASMFAETIIAPLLKAHCFVFAALGLVEIVFDAPISKGIVVGDKDYLTVFDGARGVRLTALGEYVFGKTDSYTPKAPSSGTEAIEKGRVELDTERMIATLYGNDIIMKMYLEKFMQPLTSASGTSTYRFKMNYSSFLHGCSTLEDVSAKIVLFKSRVAAHPPQLWEDFFANVKAKVEPLADADFYVMRIKPSPELTHLLTNDETLKRIVLRAEGYHILVRPKDMVTLRKRLEFHGYLIQK
jgi:hypothetical protein